MMSIDTQQLEATDEWGRVRCQLMVAYADEPQAVVQCALVAEHAGECDTLPDVPDLAHAASARVAWENLELGDGPGRPGRGAMEDALALVPDNAVFQRAVMLMEARRETMGARCDTLLNPHLMQVEIPRGDAVEMQTIVASYADTLDGLNAVLDSMINYLEAQVSRLLSVAGHQDTKSFDALVTDCELSLAAVAENVDALVEERDLSDRVSLLMNQVERAARNTAALQVEVSKLMACRAARAQVLRVWLLALLVERRLSRLAR
jgi:hypothetical protein